MRPGTTKRSIHSGKHLFAQRKTYFNFQTKDTSFLPNNWIWNLGWRKVRGPEIVCDLTAHFAINVLRHLWVGHTYYEQWNACAAWQRNDVIEKGNRMAAKWWHHRKTHTAYWYTSFFYDVIWLPCATCTTLLVVTYAHSQMAQHVYDKMSNRNTYNLSR